MQAQAANSYDVVIYEGYPFAQTHPNRLATLASLFGLNPTPIDHCRVLELGCGDGGNLIPMAFALPESKFIGVDLAPDTIARGQAFAAEMELGNIELRCRDILDLDESLGKFDYIIAHGVYSWVPTEVREKMMKLCRELLTPHGVAYISYNCYPGYHLRDLAREMMYYHLDSIDGGIKEPFEQVEQGLGLLKWLLLKFPNREAARKDLYGTILTEEVDRMISYRHHQQMYHDELNPHNTPFYFHQFIETASRHGLKFLAEADYYEMQDYIYPPPVRDFLTGLRPDQIVMKEQYLDFLKCRAFRQTLLCRQEAPIKRELQAAQMQIYHLSSQAKAVSSSPNLHAGILEEFSGSYGATLQTDHSLAKAALLHLRAQWPKTSGWEEVIKGAQAQLEKAGIRIEPDESDLTVLSEIVLAAAGSGLIQLHSNPIQLVTEISARPEASLLARKQAASGATVTNLLHKSVDVEDTLGLLLLQLLDGTRDRENLCVEMISFIKENGSFTRPDGSAIEDEQEIRQIVMDGIDRNLPELARMALLVK